MKKQVKFPFREPSDWQFYWKIAEIFFLRLSAFCLSEGMAFYAEILNAFAWSMTLETLSAFYTFM